MGTLQYEAEDGRLNRILLNDGSPDSRKFVKQSNPHEGPLLICQIYRSVQTGGEVCERDEKLLLSHIIVTCMLSTEVQLYVRRS